MTALTAPSVKQGWSLLLKTILNEGKTVIDQDGRTCTEIQNALLTITDPSDALTVVREMQQQPEWVYPSPEELKSIILGKGQGAHEYSYAPRLFGGSNQIEQFIIPLLRANPQSRRAVAILYQPDVDSRLVSKNVPSLLSVHFRFDTALAMTCHIRSNDVFIGFPANVYQLRCLQEFVAHELGVEPGALHIFSSSAHVFQEYEEQYTRMLKNAKHHN